MTETHDTADDQLSREVEEAARVQCMPPADRLAWLSRTWGKLQVDARALFPLSTSEGEGSCRHFRSIIEKNRFDEDREIEQAIQSPLHTGKAHQ